MPRPQLARTIDRAHHAVPEEVQSRPGTSIEQDEPPVRARVGVTAGRRDAAQRQVARTRGQLRTRAVRTAGAAVHQRLPTIPFASIPARACATTILRWPAW
jgi:hypothetical protein